MARRRAQALRHRKGVWRTMAAAGIWSRLETAGFVAVPFANAARRGAGCGNLTAAGRLMRQLANPVPSTRFHQPGSVNAVFEE